MVVKGGPTIVVDTLFAPLAEFEHLGLAVSGGGDSIAMMHLMHDWMNERAGHPKLSVLTVDHGLREESRSEADHVASEARRLGLSHRSLRWTREAHINGNLPAAAREARYGLMSDACGEIGAQALVTAHTLDDQAETVLMRLGRGSGVDGLAAMSARSNTHGLPILRPLLGVSRDALRAYLRERSVAWFEDPTNNDTRYDRIKARTLLADGEQLGLSQARLAATADQMSNARAVLEDAADLFETRAVEATAQGYYVIDRHALEAARRDTALRVLARLAQRLSGSVYRPRYEALQGFLLAALHPQGAKTATLLGCRLVPDGENAALVREARACEQAILPSGVESFTWDGRFAVSAETSVQGSIETTQSMETGLRALGDEGWQMLCRDRDAADKLRDIPFAARLALPALYRQNELLAVPSERINLSPDAPHCIIKPIFPFAQGGVEHI